ncbi:MAG: transposase [Opitutaceae bacterium]|nr:transposase [Opitutaceae bacterium]
MNAIISPTDATAAATSTVATNSKTRTRTCWTEQDKAECLALFAQSGLSAADFCRQLGISAATFSLWRRHARSGEAPSVERALHFAQVCLMFRVRLVDLHRILFENFHAPGMGGKTSIKRVLPALWAVDSPVKRQAPFDEFPADLDPYAYLKSIGGVTDGCGAMEQYVAMQNAVGEAREQIANALRRYVRVDALAMNFILAFWRWRLAEAARVDERRLVAA